MPGEIEALLSWRGQGPTSIGRERVAMLQAVAEQGSITRAAKALGLSYKTVWDGIDAINNLLPRPALIAQSGGKGGGGAILTEEGRKLIVSFRRLEEKLAQITATLVEGEDFHPDLLFWSVAVKTSARNAFRCRVTAVEAERVAVTVMLELAVGKTLTAIVTRDSAEDLGLVPGREVLALIKASFVTLGPGTGNRFEGSVVKRIDGEKDSEIAIDIGGGKTLTAMAPRDACAAREGERIEAHFSPSQVILAVG